MEGFGGGKANANARGMEEPLIGPESEGCYGDLTNNIRG